MVRMGLRILLIVATAELCLRGYDWWMGEQRIFQRDMGLGFRVRPNLERVFHTNTGEAYLLETNSRGYRDREHPFPRDDRRSRVVLLGSSTAFGFGVDQTEVFTEVIESLSRDMEIVNLSVPCTSLDQHYLLLRDEGLEYQPDLVLTFVTLLDAQECFWPYQIMANKPKSRLSYDEGQISIHPPRYTLVERLMSSSFVWQRFVNVALTALFLLDSVNDTSEEAEPFIPGQSLTPHERCQALRLLLARGRDLCKSRGVDYVVVYLPMPNELSGRRDTESKLLREGVLHRLSVEDGIEVVDLWNSMEQIWHLEDNLVEDEFHVNARGHAVIAQHLAVYLMLKLGPRGGSPPAEDGHTRQSPGRDNTR